MKLVFTMPICTSYTRVNAVVHPTAKVSVLVAAASRVMISSKQAGVTKYSSYFLRWFVFTLSHGMLSHSGLQKR